MRARASLWIDGKRVPEFEGEYALRWNQLPGENTPQMTLYHNGRRVTRDWRIKLDADVPADSFGGNANTDA